MERMGRTAKRRKSFKPNNDLQLGGMAPTGVSRNELAEGGDVEQDCDGGLGGQEKTYQGSRVVREDRHLTKKKKEKKKKKKSPNTKY